MSGGGGTTYRTTKTGLGDQQYANLSRGQENIRGDISQIGDGSEEEIRKVQGQVRDVSQDVGNLGRDQDQGFQGVNRNINNQTQQLSGEIGSVGQSVSGLGDSIGGVQESVTQGFGSVNNQFSDVGNQLSGLSNDVSQGFSNTGDQIRTGLSDLDTSMGDQFNQASQERMQGFSGLSDQVGSGFAGQSEFLQGMSQNVLGGQQTIQDVLGDTSNRLDTYYGDLAGRQGEIQQQVSGVQGGLSDFTAQYDDDTKMADQTRADLQDAVVNQTNRIRNDLGRVQNQQQQQQSRLMDSVSGVDETVQEGNQANEQRFQLAESQRQEQGNTFGNRLNGVRDLLVQTGQNLDQTTRQQYTDLVNSFDSQGNLIQNSINDQGITISRALDQQGNLLVNRFDQNGSQIARNLLNVPTMLEEAQRYQDQLLGGGASVPQGGFAGSPLPFAQTR